MSERRIGVYICHCGGNISDVVDVAQVKDALKDEADVVVAETSLFACSDGTQQDIVQAIQDQHLDGLVVASCSPKLHLFTFRGVSKRAGLNPYAYTQVDIREQDSWAHGDDPAGATRKAIGLVRAGIAKTRLTDTAPTHNGRDHAEDDGDRRRHCGAPSGDRACGHGPRRRASSSASRNSEAGWRASVRCTRTTATAVR